MKRDFLDLNFDVWFET